MTGSPKTTRWEKFPAGKSSELNDTKSNQKQATQAGENALSNQLKLHIARKNWEEAMNPAAAFAQTKKAKEGIRLHRITYTARQEKGSCRRCCL
jgi:hypothetical protein